MRLRSEYHGLRQGFLVLSLPQIRDTTQSRRINQFQMFGSGLFDLISMVAQPEAEMVVKRRAISLAWVSRPRPLRLPLATRGPGPAIITSLTPSTIQYQNPKFLAACAQDTRPSGQDTHTAPQPVTFRPSGRPGELRQGLLTLMRGYSRRLLLPRHLYPGIFAAHYPNV